MKVIIVALAFVAAAAAAAIGTDPVPEAVFGYLFEQDPEGPYRYGYETEKGTKIEALGERKTVQNDENQPIDVIVARGTYSYVDPDGNVQSVVYYADETGYHVDSPAVRKAASRR